VPVPQPTTESTGVAQKYLSKLRGKHVFWSKSIIMETGQKVTISPKPGGKLFIPFNGNPPEDATPSEIARGFMMYPGSVTMTPGGNNVGTFTAYWEAYWNGPGAATMREHAESRFLSDLETVMKFAGNKRGQLKPPTAAGFHRSVKAAQNRAAKQMMSRSERRD
jgi:hypothetical protein